MKSKIIVIKIIMYFILKCFLRFILSFTSKEFDFINNASIGGQTIDNLIDKENKLRDTIVSLINNLESSQGSLAASNANIEFLNELQDIFSKTNDNIKMLTALKNDFSSISEKTVDLLI